MTLTQLTLLHLHYGHKPEPQRGKHGPRMQCLSPSLLWLHFRPDHPSEPPTPGCQVLWGLSFSMLHSSVLIPRSPLSGCHGFFKAFFREVRWLPAPGFPPPTPHLWQSEPESLDRQSQTHLADKKQRLPTQTLSKSMGLCTPV